ncbi:MAG: hypothetical protein HONBIEJF_02983 [Fimbriimonadaceae bacterium]|nr:hypothetical protein [Fimbriimonadaceae bacterium]
MTHTNIRFTELKKGDRARVTAMTSTDAGGSRLHDLGLTIGTELLVVKVAPFGDPIEIEFRGTRLCLRKRETSSIAVELVGGL